MKQKINAGTSKTWSVNAFHQAIEKKQVREYNRAVRKENRLAKNQTDAFLVKHIRELLQHGLESAREEALTAHENARQTRQNLRARRQRRKGGVTSIKDLKDSAEQQFLLATFKEGKADAYRHALFFLSFYGKA
jgi:hypothetical protein